MTPGLLCLFLDAAFEGGQGRPEQKALYVCACELHNYIQCPSFSEAAPKTGFYLNCLRNLRGPGILNLINYLRHTVKIIM